MLSYFRSLFYLKKSVPFKYENKSRDPEIIDYSGVRRFIGTRGQQVMLKFEY